MPSPTNFEEIVNCLADRPTEPCVIREEFLDEIGVKAAAIAQASGREFRRAFEIHATTISNIGMRDYVYEFAPMKEEA